MSFTQHWCIFPCPIHHKPQHRCARVRTLPVLRNKLRHYKKKAIKGGLWSIIHGLMDHLFLLFIYLYSGTGNTGEYCEVWGSSSFKGALSLKRNKRGSKLDTGPEGIHHGLCVELWAGADGRSVWRWESLNWALFEVLCLHWAHDNVRSSRGHSWLYCVTHRHASFTQHVFLLTTLRRKKMKFCHYLTTTHVVPNLSFHGTQSRYL